MLNWPFVQVMGVIYATVLFFTTVVLSLVVVAKAVCGTIHFVLANILIASITMGLGVLSINSDLFTHTDVSFQIFLAITAIGGNRRPAFMAVLQFQLSLS